jgi:predicted transcriptional regulator
MFIPTDIEALHEVLKYETSKMTRMAKALNKQCEYVKALSDAMKNALIKINPDMDEYENSRMIAEYNKREVKRLTQ